MSLQIKPPARRFELPGLGLVPRASALGELRLPTPNRGLAEPLREIPVAASARAKIWELHATFHCSIIGTCLTTGELRALVAKLQLSPKAETSDHELHKIAVTLAGMRGTGVKLLNKTLDRKFRREIAAFGTAHTAAEVRAAWDTALEAGDIPGSYWAVMTHPATSEALVRHVFGEIHMLSHLVGAANRADIRRLRELEAETTDLRAKVERQQDALRGAVVERDRQIAELRLLLAAAVTTAGPAPSGTAPADPDRRAEALTAVLTDTKHRLARSDSRVTQLENRVRDLDQRAAAASARATASETEAELVREECRALETQLAALLAPPADAPVETPVHDLGGATLLYVGGRAGHMPHLRALVESFNGTLLHHSGGSEESTASLPACISRAQAVLFPVDCVSHVAMLDAKRLCKLAGKPYVPLRSASLAALLRGLAELQARRQPDPV